MNIEVEIAEIRKDIAYIKQELEGNIDEFRDHIKTAEEYRNKVVILEATKKELDAHVLADKWMFGILITMNLAILVKVFT